MARLTLLGAVLAIVLVLAGGNIVGCDSKKGVLIPNRLPGVELTATPPAGDTTRYDIEFSWTGWDYDGEVDHFEYYIDPPPELIENPEAFPDTLDWQVTDDYAGRFTFYAPDYDTSTIDDPPPGTDFKRPQIGLGYHVFVIRAVDDMGAASVVNDSSWVAFTSATICPKTTIITPPPSAAEGTNPGGYQYVGQRVTFRWDGTDPDGIFSDRPDHYLFKAVDISDAPGIVLWGDVDDLVLDDPAPWDTLEPGVTKVTATLDNNHMYGVAVRAVDEAHSVEPLLVINRNLLWVGAFQASSFPTLSISSSAFGVRPWSGWSVDIEEYEVPLGSLFEFSLSANADVYGGLITGYSYGWNLEDVESTETNPTGMRAWTPWSTSQTRIVANFNEDLARNPDTGEIQDVFLYVKCKDDGGAVTLATIQFNVVVLDPIYKVGFVDDYRFAKPGVNPKLGEFQFDDPFWQKMLKGYDYIDPASGDPAWKDRVWDEWDVDPTGEDAPSLEFLAKFETLIWWADAPSRQTYSAFYYMNKLDVVNALAVYLSSESKSGTKGKAWLYGDGMVATSILPILGLKCIYPYSVNENAPTQTCAIRPGTFSYDFMHIVGSFDKNDGSPSGARVNKFGGSGDVLDHLEFEEVGPSIADTLYVFDPAVNPAPYRNLPRSLEPDIGRNRVIPAMRAFETLEYPRPYAPEQLLFFEPSFGDTPGKNTGLVPLYKFIAVNKKSSSNGHYCAFRYIPTHGEQGEIVYFWFPMFMLKEVQARQVAKAVLTDMFGLPDPDTWEPGGSLKR